MKKLAITTLMMCILATNIYGQASKWFDKGMQAYDRENYSKAIKYYLKSIEKEEQDGPTYYNLALCYLIVDQYDEGILVLNQAEINYAQDVDDVDELKRLNADIYALRSDLYYWQDEYDLAELYTTKYLEYDSTDIFYLDRRAEIRTELSKFDLALLDVNQILKLGNPYKKGDFRKAIVLTGMQNYAEAIPYLRNYLSIYENDSYALYYLADALYYTDQNNEAFEVCNQMVELDPNNAWAYYLRAYIRDELGLFYGSINDMEKAAELDPYFEDALREFMEAGFEDEVY